MTDQTTISVTKAEPSDLRDIPIYSEQYDVQKEVTQATIATLTNSMLGLAGSIAYLDKGASLYNNFKKSTLPENNSAKSEPATLITTHKESLAREIKDIERLIIIGGGAYESIQNQELALLSGIYAGGNKPNLKEVVLIDVSEDFLHQGVSALKKLESDHSTSFDIKLVRADFKKVAMKFDTIMTEGFHSKKIQDVKAAVLMTGGTFGNLEGISATDRFPGAEIDKQMAHLADFVGDGSTVMFDYFSKMEAGVGYYNKPQLSEFFNNIPRIMQKYCKNLEGLYPNPDLNDEMFFRYRARSLQNARLIAHELIAETNQSPKIVNGIERLFPIARNDTLTMMFSLRAHASDILGRPHQNTGLQSASYVSNGDLVMHSFKRVGMPGATHQPAIEFSEPNLHASNEFPAYAAGRSSIAQGVKNFVSSFKHKPLIPAGLAV